MTEKQRAIEKARRLEQAMFPLIADTRFQDFLSVVRELKDEAVIQSVMTEKASSERLSLMAKGEIKTFLDILGIADAYQHQLEARQQDAEQQV